MCVYTYVYMHYIYIYIYIHMEVFTGMTIVTARGKALS